MRTNTKVDLVGSKEAGQILGVTRMTLSRWAQDGTLPPVTRVSDSDRAAYLFNRSDVVALANRRAEETPEKDGAA